MAINTIENIQEYNQEIFEPKFKQTKLYKQLNQEYDHVIFDTYNNKFIEITPRELYGKRYFSAVPFYFIEILREKNPKEIYDLGCGWNIFKKYYPEIIGVGAELTNFLGDIHDIVDEDFIAKHQNYFESVFSINALHFIPLEDFQKRVIDFHSMIKPNGRGWLSLNLQRMIENSVTNQFDNFTTDNYENYVREKLAELKFKYISVDINLQNRNSFMDGNIKIVIDR